MNPINKVQLTGNLGADPEIKTFEGPSKRATFSLATNESYKNREGEQVTRTEWHFVTAWGRLAEKVESELRKGAFVSVEGRLTSRTFKDKEGNTRYFTEVVANDIALNKKNAE